MGAWVGRGMGGRGNGGVWDALEKFVDRHALLSACDSRLLQIEIVNLWNAARTVDNQIRFKCLLSLLHRSFHCKLIAILLDGFHSSVHKNLHAQLTRVIHKLVHEVRIEVLERARPAMKNSNFRSGARCDVRDFERNITTANENDSSWQLLQFQKLIALSEIPFT